jgi:hypothetical protein
VAEGSEDCPAVLVAGYLLVELGAADDRSGVPQGPSSSGGTKGQQRSTEVRGEILHA